MNGDVSGTHRPVSRAAAPQRAMELLWPLEAASFVAAAPLLRLPGRGDGHPVLVLPGFTADDASTIPLRWSIRGEGYSTHAWRLGRNIGPHRTHHHRHQGRA